MEGERRRTGRWKGKAERLTYDSQHESYIRLLQAERDGISQFVESKSPDPLPRMLDLVM